MINSFLKKYEFVEIHKKEIPLPQEKVFAAFQRLDFSKSILIRFLLRLRGLNPYQKLAQLFTPLLNDPPHEVIWGLVAKPWKLKGDVLKLTPDQFTLFDTPGFAKIVWGFTFKSTPTGTLVTTETRIHCTDPSSRRKFTLYWFFIRPFSGLLRIAMLNLLAKLCLKVN